MLESCRNAQERWGGVHQLIDRWLHERQQLVQAFDALSGIQAPAPKAFGDQRGLELAKQIFPRLEAITESALNFNDRCDNGDCREGACLIAELKVLRQQLHERFELEDCLIEVLHNAHSQSGAEGSAVPV